MKTNNLCYLPISFFFILLVSCNKTDISPQVTDINSKENHLSKIEINEATLSEESANGNSIVSGGGKFARLGIFGEALGPEVQFAVHAILKKDLSVKGKLVYHSSQVDVQGNIDCIRLFPLINGGILASLSGVMTKVEPSDAYYFDGARFGFTVYDRGEGNSAMPDQVIDISNIIDESDCTNFFIPGVFPYPLTSGNIQIKQ